MTGIEIAAITSAVSSAAAAASTAAPYIAAASAAGSAAMSLQAGAQQAAGLRSQAEATRVNAEIQRQTAASDRMAAEADAARLSDEGRRRRATGVNALAGGGIDPATGSAALALDDLAAGSALEASIARWRGAQSATARTQQANFMDAEAGGLDIQARQAMRNRWWRAGTTLLTQGSRLMAPASMPGKPYSSLSASMSS